MNHEFNNPQWPFLITVRDLDGKTLINATFKHRAGGPKNPNKYDMIVTAKTARIHFDTANNLARVYLDGAEIMDPHKDYSLINDSILEFPIPAQNRGMEKRIQERTTPELVVEQQKNRKLMAKERKRQSMAAALWIASGRLHRVDWPQVQRSFVDYGDWEMKCRSYETEKQQRTAMAWGSLFFVLLGAPVGILFARRDFLSAFISCFVPIIILYYPLILLGTNMGKDGLLYPTAALWMGNAVLGVLAGFVLPSVAKH